MAGLTSRRRYTNGAPEATLATAVNAAATTFTLSTSTGFPPVPFTATLDYQGVAEEVVLVTAMSGVTVTNCQRGYDGTIAQSHSVGALFVHTLIGKDLDEANDHSSSTVAHGTAGDVVGTSDTQTLTNKVISSSRHQATSTDPAAKLQAAAAGSAALLQALDQAGTGVLLLVTRAGAVAITPNDPAVIPLLLQGAASQSADLVNINDGAAVKRLAVSPQGAVVLWPNSYPGLKIIPKDATQNDLVLFRNSTDTGNKARIDTFGNIEGAAFVADGSGLADAFQFPSGGAKFKVDTDGDVFGANMGGRVGHFIDTVPFSAAGGGATEGMGHSHPYPVVNGRRYRFTANFQTSAASGVTIREMTARVSSGAVSNVSSLIFRRQAPLTGTLRDDRQYSGEFVATATGTWNIALGISTQGGAGQTNVDASEVFLDDVGT